MSNQMLITIDLETLPSASPYVRQMCADRIRPPGTMSKPETIAKWEAEAKGALIDEAVAKTGLDGTYGSIAVIGFAFGDEPPQTLVADERCEYYVLMAFMEMMHERCTARERVIFCGHNIHGFDLPFMFKRCVVNKVRPSPWLPFGQRAYSAQIADTMLMWDDNRERRISLKNLCAVLGVTSSKGDIDGSNVAAAWDDGRWEDVADYCADDVIATRECYKRIAFKD